jgi:uncharacterized membrane protein
MKLLLVATIYFVGPFLIILLFNKVKTMRKVGSILMAYTLGGLLSLIHLFPSDPTTLKSIINLQESIMNLAVPIAIPLLLISSDYSLWKKAMRKTLSALIGGILAIALAIVLGFFIFRHSGMIDFWKACGMLTGLYTGGTLNLVAIGQGLHADPTLFTLLSTFDMVLSFFFLLFIVGGGFRFFRWILPYRDSTLDTTTNMGQPEYGFENYTGMFRKKTILGLLLSIGFLAIAAVISLLLTNRLNELIVILTITTLSIGASFFKGLRTLPKTFELGMILIILFSIVVSSQFDPTKLNAQQWNIILFVGFVLVMATFFHLLISRITKIPGDLFTVAHVALLYSPPFVPPVAAAMHNKKVMVSGIVIGLIGWAVGTYLGVGLAQLLHLIPN